MTSGDCSGSRTQAAALAALIALSSALEAGSAQAAPKIAAPSVALVMELSGATKPALAVHREVAAGTRIEIQSGAHLALLHYATCSIVSFSGGTVKVTEEGLEAPDANVESRQRGPCPRTQKIALAGPGALGGGVVSRGITHQPREYAEVANDGLIVLTGARAASAQTADIFDSNRLLVVGDIPIRQESFRLNGVLPPRRPYFVNIHFRGRSKAVEVPISISASDAKGLLILQLE